MSLSTAVFSLSWENRGRKRAGGQDIPGIALSGHVGRFSSNVRAEQVRQHIREHTNIFTCLGNEVSVTILTKWECVRKRCWAA